MTIEIGDDLYALDLAIQDRIALATMRKRPRIGNRALAKLLGVSDSGVRAMIRRFKAKKLVKEIRFDGTREFKVLVGNQDAGGSGRQNLTKTATPAIRQKVTDAPPPGLTQEERSRWKSLRYGNAMLELDAASRSINKLRMASFFADKFSRLVQQIASDSNLLEADRKRLLTTAESSRNFYTAANHVLLHIPDKQAPAALKVLRQATHEQLSTFYERSQNGQLGGGEGHLLIGLGTI
jgi:DNA-binding Lrp family transcriptional regulator